MDFQEYGYFDSEIIGYDDEGFPILDRAQNSEIFALFFAKLVSNGVLAAPADCLMVQAYEGMTVNIAPGFVIINGHFGYNPQTVSMTIDKAPSQYKRITAVIARVDYAERKVELILRNGEAASNPVPPEILQPASGDFYELCLAKILVNSNQTVITQSSITDTRYDSSLCGVVTQLIDHLDTSVFSAQLTAFYNEYVMRFNVDYADFVLKMNTAYQNFYDKLNELYAGYVERYNTDYAKFTSDMLTAYNQYLSDLSAYFQSVQDKGNSDIADIVRRMTEFETDQEALWNEWFDAVKGKMSGDVAANIVLRLDDHENRLSALEEMVVNGEVAAPLSTEDKDTLATESGDVLEAFFYYVTK